MVENHNDPESFPELSKTFTIMKLPYQMPNDLREMLGLSKVALSYVVRYSSTSPVLLPSLNPNLIWSLEKSCVVDELVAYMPNIGPSYEADNAQVYNLLAKSLSGTNSMTSITRHQRWRDVS